MGLNEVESAFILFGFRRIFNESGFEMTFSASSVTFVDKSVKRSDCKQTVVFEDAYHLRIRNLNSIHAKIH